MSDKNREIKNKPICKFIEIETGRCKLGKIDYTKCDFDICESYKESDDQP